MGRKRASKFLREAVVLFGFLNGVWLAVGVNPGQRLLAVLQGIVERLTGNEWIPFLFTLLPLLLLLAMLVFIARRGGVLGFVAVGLAFVAGLNVIAAPLTALALLVAAALVGWFAAK